MSTYPISLFFIELVAASIIYTWLFNSTKGSVLIVTIYHAVFNTVGAIFEVERWIHTIIITAAALLVVLLFGLKNLSKVNKQIYKP